jgi:hypothetical protein
MTTLHEALLEVNGEVERATEKFDAFRSVHEAEAVIRKEMDEFTKAVRAGYVGGFPLETTYEMRTEAVQLAAMAVRFLVETRARQ